MAYLIAVHGLGEDPDTYRKYYFDTHLPLAKALPGLRRYEISDGPVLDADGSQIAEFVAVMEFDSVAAIRLALTEPEGHAAINDLPNFAAPHQIKLMMFDTKVV